MILNRIEQLEARVQAASIPDEHRAQLLALLAAMREEAAGLPSSSETAPATDAEQPIETVLGDIQKSLNGLEASHPRLTQLANQVAVTLSNMGI